MEQPQLSDEQRSAMLSALDSGAAIHTAREIAQITRDDYHAYLNRGRGELADGEATDAARFANAVAHAGAAQAAVEAGARDSAAVQRFMATQASAKTVALSRKLTTW